jgi:hypothetical protein
MISFACIVVYSAIDGPHQQVNQLGNLRPTKILRAKMSLTRSNPLHQHSLSLAQVMVHRRDIFMKIRQAAYDYRDSCEAKFNKEIKYADKGLLSILQDQRSGEYKKIKIALDRFSLNPPINVAEAKNSAVKVQLRFALLSSMLLDIISKFDNHTKMLAALAFFTTDLPLSPSIAIRSNPQCPGAPTYSLLH